jgi:hypothetical protein
MVFRELKHVEWRNLRKKDSGKVEIKNESKDEDENNIEFDISDFKDIEEILKDEEDFENLENAENDDCFECDKLEKLEFVDPKLFKYLDDKKKESKYKLVTRRIDNNRIRHKNTKNQEIYTSVLKNVKMLTDSPIRSGAIIYTHHGGKTYFCLGQDSIYGDLTDFSGGKKQNETVIEAGLRELEEESLGIFGKLTVTEVKESMGFYCTNMLIMFIRRDIDMEETKKKFNDRLQKKLAMLSVSVNDSVEVNDIIWLETKEFLEVLNGKGRRVYSRVRRILSKVIDIISAI